MVFKSRYDRFWTSIFNDIHNALSKVRDRGFAILNVKRLKQLSRATTNWLDKMIICGDKVFLKPRYSPLKSLLRIILEKMGSSTHTDCLLFKITSDLDLVIKRINYYDALVYVSRKESIFTTTLMKYARFRTFPLGTKCICDEIFKEYEWGELAYLSSMDLPNKPGVYVIRVIEHGKDPRDVSYRLIEELAKTKWEELVKYAYLRIKKLENINNCPVIFIDHSVSLRNKYRELAHLKHPLSIVFLGMIIHRWRLDYGFAVTSKDKLVEKYEETLKKYIEIHRDMPALNK